MRDRGFIVDTEPSRSIKSDRRLYLAADRATVVEEGDPEAAFLLAGAGGEIDGREVKRLGLQVVDGVVVQAAAPPAAAEAVDTALKAKERAEREKKERDERRARVEAAKRKVRGEPEPESEEEKASRAAEALSQEQRSTYDEARAAGLSHPAAMELVASGAERKSGDESTDPGGTKEREKPEDKEQEKPEDKSKGKPTTKSR